VSPAGSTVLVRPPLPCPVLIPAGLRERHEQVVKVDVLTVALSQPVEVVDAAPSTWFADDHEPPAAQVAQADGHNRTGSAT